MANNKVSLSTLNELAYNPRFITDEKFERLKTSIKENTEWFAEEDRLGGFRLAMSVTVNKNGNRIIGGHQRLKALHALGQDWVHADDITWVQMEPASAEEKALNVILNGEHTTGEWDQEKLNDVLEDIRVDNSELFDALEFNDLGAEIEDLGADIEFETEEPVPKKARTTDEEYHPEDTGPVRDKFKGEPGSQVLHVGDGDDGADGISDVVGDADSPEDNLPPLPPPEETTADDVPHDQLFPISYAVTVKQREHVTTAIKMAKEKFEVGTAAEALACICEKFLESVTQPAE